MTAFRSNGRRPDPHRQATPDVSFEFFPPKTPEMEQSLWRAVKRLEPLRPRFMSVTYGAGGGTRQRTHAIVRRILEETPIAPAAHLTCVAASADEVDGVARDYWEAGIRHIVALRGDPPAGIEAFEPHPDGYQFAADLVAGLKRVADFEISVAAYPETHPEATSREADLDNLKRKLDAGAVRAITQYFFEPEMYERFIERVRAAGITAPVVPGIMPVVNFAQMKRFSQACGASVPRWIEERFSGLDDDPPARRKVAVEVALALCDRLRESGVNEFHFYTLNRAELTTAICRGLGITAVDEPRAPVSSVAAHAKIDNSPGS